MTEVTDATLTTIAGTIERLLIEEREGIAYASKNMGEEGFKLTIGVKLDRTTDGFVVNYRIGYPLEPRPEPVTRQKVEKRETIA
jgi:hypothetical protein